MYTSYFCKGKESTLLYCIMYFHIIAILEINIVSCNTDFVKIDLNGTLTIAVYE